MFVHHHLGLGDHLICNGLVRFIAERERVKLFCKTQNEFNLKLMYSDNSNIEIIGVYNDFEAEKIANNHPKYIRLGVGLNHNYPGEMEKYWDKVFYYQIGIDFDHSWKSFKYNKSTSQNSIPNEPYVLLCNQGSDGIDRLDYSVIDHRLQKKYSNNGNFFDNIELIQNAKEIHCINSSYIHLIDRIETSRDTKLVYHKNFMYKNHSDFTLKKNWVII